MRVSFDTSATENGEVKQTVQSFFNDVDTLERARNAPVLIHQDGVKKSYYVRCSISAKTMSELISLDARLDPQSTDTFRDNRELLLKHNTFIRMRLDAENEREFNDIIAEYITLYLPDKPLKVWGGQHRSRAIIDAYLKKGVSRYHGFRLYFCLSKEQRSELALVSNTNIAVSNDLFDRQLEETLIGPHLRNWCVRVGLLDPDEDFPDVGSRAETITTQGARSFVVNFFKAKEYGERLSDDQLDMTVYEPYLCESGVVLDEEYRGLIDSKGKALWDDRGLVEAGEAFARLHLSQYEAIKKSKINRKGFRMKAFTASVLSSWSYIAGLLQSRPTRLENHLSTPPSCKGIPDPLNAEEMSKFKHDQDPETYRGLGTRSALKDRQRMAQVFLARSRDSALVFDRRLLNQAVSQVVGLKAMSRGYTA